MPSRPKRRRTSPPTIAEGGETPPQQQQQQPEVVDRLSPQLTSTPTSQTRRVREQQPQEQPTIVISDDDDDDDDDDYDGVEEAQKRHPGDEVEDVIETPPPPRPMTFERVSAGVSQDSPPPPPSSSSAPIQCRLCDRDKAFRSQRDLSVHLTFIHYRDKIMKRIKWPYECFMCKFKPSTSIDASAQADELLMHYGCEEGVAEVYYQQVSFFQFTVVLFKNTFLILMNP